MSAAADRGDPSVAGRRFRFGVVGSGAATGAAWTAQVLRIEAMGYATVVVPDVVAFGLSPLPALAAAATATSTLRVGTYVLANDYRSPVLLAKDIATLDVLSDGRVELGIGVGRENAASDYALLGIPFDPGGTRVSRLARSLEVIDAVLSGRTAEGEPGALSILPRPVQRPRPPILVAAGGPRMLALAGRHADIVALAVGPTETEEGLRDRIAIVREAAASRFDRIELNLNLMAVGDRVPAYLSQRLGLSADALRRSGSAVAALGSVDEMCETVLRRRDALGISYLLVGDELAEAFAPVVERLAGR